MTPTNSEYARGARYGLAAVCIWAGFIVVATAHPGHAGGAQATDWGVAGEMRSRSRGGWRGSAANSAPVSFLAEQGGERRGFSASWQFATRYDHGDPWNKGHPIGQTHLFKPKDVRTIRVRPELEATAPSSR